MLTSVENWGKEPPVFMSAIKEAPRRLGIYLWQPGEEHLAWLFTRKAESFAENDGNIPCPELGGDSGVMSTSGVSPSGFQGRHQSLRRQCPALGCTGHCFLAPGPSPSSESLICVWALTQHPLEMQPSSVTKENLMPSKTCQSTGY